MVIHHKPGKGRVACGCVTGAGLRDKRRFTEDAEAVTCGRCREIINRKWPKKASQVSG